MQCTNKANELSWTCLGVDNGFDRVTHLARVTWKNTIIYSNAIVNKMSISMITVNTTEFQFCMFCESIFSLHGMKYSLSDKSSIPKREGFEQLSQMYNSMETTVFLTNRKVHRACLVGTVGSTFTRVSGFREAVLLGRFGFHEVWAH